MTTNLSINPQQALPIEIITRLMNFMDSAMDKDLHRAELSGDVKPFISDHDLGDEDPGDLFEV